MQTAQQPPTERVCLSEQIDRSVKAKLYLLSRCFPTPQCYSVLQQARLSLFIEEDTLTERRAEPGGSWHFLPEALCLRPSGFRMSALHLKEEKVTYLPCMFCIHNMSSFKNACFPCKYKLTFPVPLFLKFSLWL